jgi:hypothetical protein
VTVEGGGPPRGAPSGATMAAVARSLSIPSSRCRTLAVVAAIVVATVAAETGGASSAAAAAPEPGGLIVVLPLRSRGLTAPEHKRVASKVTASFRDVRAEVISPEEIGARLARDERHRTALDDARRFTADGVEKSQHLDHGAALERFDRALALYRDHFGEYADPAGLGETFLRRGAERLAGGDSGGARADFFSAVTFAPDVVPSLDDFPPPVVEAWEASRADRLRRPLAGDDAQEIAALGAALGSPNIATMRAEKGDRPEDGVSVELAVWPGTPSGAAPRTSRALLSTPLDAQLDGLSVAAGAVGGAPRTAVASIGSRPVDVSRPDPLRPRTGPVRVAPRNGGAGGDRPLWKNPWIWAGAALLVGAGAGAGYVSSQQKPKSDGFQVIVTPGS